MTSQGMSRKVFFPFQKTLYPKDVFDIKICGIMRDIFPSEGKTYYFVRMSFMQRVFQKKINYKFTISFLKKPKEIRRYEIDRHKNLYKKGKMPKYEETNERYIFMDEDKSTTVSDIKLYIFER